MRINYFKFSIMEREVAGGGGGGVCVCRGGTTVGKTKSESIGG